MGESLWIDWPEYIKDTLYAAMGPAGGYSSLVVQTANVANVKNFTDWAGWTLPALSVRCMDQDPTPERVHGGKLHWQKRYPTIITFIVDGELEDAINDSKILLSRAETVIQNWHGDGFPGLVDSRGETMIKLEVGNSLATVGLKPACTSDYYGVTAYGLVMLSRL